MTQITWEINYLSPPHIIRYCKKCGRKSEYECSGLFRINAQKKVIDVWLIYKCTNCDTTWNMTIITRVNPLTLPSAVLDGFHTNDGQLIMTCAMDSRLIKQNGAEPCFPEYNISGSKLPYQMLVELTIINPYPGNLKLAAVLRKSLEVSAQKLNQLVDNRCICCSPDIHILKCKIPGSITLTIQLPVT